MREFFSMGGYAAFLWPAYAITVVALVFNIAAARGALREAQRAARQRMTSDAVSNGEGGRS